MNTQALHRDVAVTGIGLLTPAGVGTADTWSALCRGTATARPVPGLDPAPVRFACTLPSGFDPLEQLGPGARRMDRFAQLAVWAARQAVQDAGLAAADLRGLRVAVVLGTGFAGTTTWERQVLRLHRQGPAHVAPLTVPSTIPNMSVAQICLDLGLHGTSLTVSTACASGTTAIAVATDLLASG